MSESLVEIAFGTILSIDEFSEAGRCNNPTTSVE